MSLAFQRLKVYVRLTSVVLLSLAIGAVLVANRGNAVAVWFFGLTDETVRVNVVWLMLCTAAATLLSWWVFSFSWSLMRDMRDISKQEAVRKQEEELKKREADVAAREQIAERKIERVVATRRSLETEQQKGEEFIP